MNFFDAIKVFIDGCIKTFEDGFGKDGFVDKDGNPIECEEYQKVIDTMRELSRNLQEASDFREAALSEEEDD